jgi:hypothetical protein
MKIKKVAYETACAVPLTADDIYVLETIYWSRLRRFGFVFLFLFVFVGFRILPFLLKHDDIQLVSGSITGLVIFFVLPFYILFRSRIWAYRRDMRAGFKYEVHHQILGKQYFPITGQYFLRLDNVDYLHHEVEPFTYESLEVGGYYPVYFAPYSKYAFNLRAKFTLM